jgi:hypothetical protein
MSSYYYMCPHTTIYVSSYYCICVLIRTSLSAPEGPHSDQTTVYVSSYYYICVLILQYVSSYYCMCPHTTIYVSLCPHQDSLERSRFGRFMIRNQVSYYYYMCHTTIYVSSYYYICVLILLHVSSYYYICPAIWPLYAPQSGFILLLHVLLLYMCPRTTICVLILLYMCPHTAIYVSAYTHYIFDALSSVCVLAAVDTCTYTYFVLHLRLVS